MSLIDKTKEYKNNKYKENKDLMHELANGQSPHSLFITCSDSRISVNELTNSKPGEVFVIRNAGNVIADYNENAPTNESLTVEYAVVALGVKEIVVCGHTSCGAMGAIKDFDGLTGLPLVKAGLEPIYKDYKLKKATELSTDELIAFNVKEQLLKLYSYPYIKEKFNSGELAINGWVYDFANGEISKEMTLKEFL